MQRITRKHPAFFMLLTREQNTAPVPRSFRAFCGKDQVSVTLIDGRINSSMIPR
jgi:hypothetical protein